LKWLRNFEWTRTSVATRGSGRRGPAVSNSMELRALTPHPRRRSCIICRQHSIEYSWIKSLALNHVWLFRIIFFSGNESLIPNSWSVSNCFTDISKYGSVSYQVRPFRISSVLYQGLILCHSILNI
jgi:hypothetical protein